MSISNNLRGHSVWIQECNQATHSSLIFKHDFTNLTLQVHLFHLVSSFTNTIFVLIFLGGVVMRNFCLCQNFYLRMYLLNNYCNIPSILQLYNGATGLDRSSASYVPGTYVGWALSSKEFICLPSSYLIMVMMTLLNGVPS